MSSSGSARVRTPRNFATPRNGLTLLIVCVCLALVFGKLGDLHAEQLFQALDGVQPWQWCLAIISTGLSFAAVGQYDALFHGWLNTGVSRRRAAISGASAIAVAQMAGLGLVSGALARWRALPELSMKQAVLVTQYVSFSFMAALGVVTATLLAISPLNPVDGIGIFAACAVILTVIAAFLSMARPACLPIRLPPLVLMGRLTLLLGVDVFFAALTLYILLPSGLSIPFGSLFLAFILGIGAGLISGAPGGVGPFELCLISLLPTLPEPELVAAILAFRLVYYVLPASMSLLCLVRPHAPERVCDTHVQASPIVMSEAKGLSCLPGQEVSVGGSTGLHLSEASQTLAAIGDRVNGTPLSRVDLSRLKSKARARGLSTALYKAGARTTSLARKSGWSVMKISEEAFLTPARFTVEGSCRRQLRRKLKHAAKAGVTVREANQLPITEMSRIAAAWAKRCGGERGFSMGRFDPDYVREQRCFLAEQNGQLVAFVTFHAGRRDWCLDLMRSDDTIADGVMHALIVRAIETAAEEQVPRLSLAAMPLETPPYVVRRVSEQDGLRRFKLTFAPDTRPLYLAAPSKLQLALAGIDILLRIRFPDPPGTASPPPALHKLQGWFDRMQLVRNPIRSHVLIKDETPCSIEVNQ